MCCRVECVLVSEEYHQLKHFQEAEAVGKSVGSASVVRLPSMENHGGALDDGTTKA